MGKKQQQQAEGAPAVDVDAAAVDVGYCGVDAKAAGSRSCGIMAAIESSFGAERADSEDGSSAAPPITVSTMVHAAFVDKWQLKTLLICVPLVAFPFSPGVTFFLAFFGLVPLAALLGDFTEDLALRSNDVIGALINVTFGNATELIISIVALRAGMFDVIKLSLIGSVLGNMLLVLGTAFLVGGFKIKEMRFNPNAVNTYGPLLMLSMMSLLIPSLYAYITEHQGDKHLDKRKATVLEISREIATLMCITYVAYLFFQLKTHRDLFDSDSSSEKGETAAAPAPSAGAGPSPQMRPPLVSEGDAFGSVGVSLADGSTPPTAGLSATGGSITGPGGALRRLSRDGSFIKKRGAMPASKSYPAHHQRLQEVAGAGPALAGLKPVAAPSTSGALGGEVEDDDEEYPRFTAVVALAGLAVVSVLISWLSDALVDTLQEAADQWGMPKQFIGLILVPIVGNAAEHASAILMAAKNKCDIAVGVALGSSIQIALFVMPVLVVVGWFVGAPLDLNLHPFLVGIALMSVLVATHITVDGKANWLEGLMLVMAYIMISLTFLKGSVQIEQV